VGTLVAGNLTAVAIKNLVKPGRYSDAGGLHLYVRAPSKQGSEPRRSWVLRYRFGGKRRDMGLGDYPEISLKEARDAADSARAQIKAGRDPITAKRAAAAAGVAAGERTFKAAANELLASKAGKFRNAKHRAQWSATLEAYAYPVLGDLPVAAITTDHVLAALTTSARPARKAHGGGGGGPLWERAPVTAARLRGRIEAVLNAAIVRQWRDGPNPARWKGHLEMLLPSRKAVRRVKHHPALPFGQIGDFMAALAQRDGAAARALEFTILTAARSGEVRGMTWGEVDTVAKVWTVPAERMKVGRVHRVPLSPQALAILRAARPYKPKAAALVFPGERPGKPLSDMTLSGIVRRMNEQAADPENMDAPPRWNDGKGRGIVPHGFRATFRDWCSNTRSDPLVVIEMCLAHSIRSETQEAYDRGDYLERRRPVMEAWGAFCAAPAAGKVVSMQRTRRVRMP
jgi:integrase